MGSPPGRARRDVVLRDNIAVNEDMSNDPRYNRTENQNSDTTERINDREFRQIWTSHTGDKASTIFAGITTHQGTASRSGELVARKDKRRGTQSSEEEERETRQRTRTQWRQWRNEPPTSSSPSFWAWNTWQWQGKGQRSKPLNLFEL